MTKTEHPAPEAEKAPETGKEPKASPLPPETGKEPKASPLPPEIGGPPGPEPTRYGDWEYKGRCTDF